MSRIQKSANVISDEVDGTMMLCHTDSVEFFRLNSTGAQIWEICENRTIDEVAERLGNVYESVDRETLTSEIQQFVASLAEAQLVVWEEVENEGTST